MENAINGVHRRTRTEMLWGLRRLHRKTVPIQVEKTSGDEVKMLEVIHVPVEVVPALPPTLSECSGTEKEEGPAEVKETSVMPPSPKECPREEAEKVPVETLSLSSQESAEVPVPIQVEAPVLSQTSSPSECFGAEAEGCPVDIPSSSSQETAEVREPLQIEVPAALPSSLGCSVAVEEEVPAEIPSSSLNQVPVFVPEVVVNAPGPAPRPPIGRTLTIEDKVERAIAKLALRHRARRFTEVGQGYIDDAFQQHVYLKRERDAMEEVELDGLFSEQWQDPRCETAWEHWEAWRHIRGMVLNWDAKMYKKYQMDSNLSGFLQSMLKKLYPARLEEDPTYDYPLLMEVVRFAGLEYSHVEELTIINVGDSHNKFEAVMSDVVRGKPVLVQSILGDNIRMMNGSKAFPVPVSYIWETNLMDAFVESLKDAHLRQRWENDYQGAEIIYHKLDTGDQGKEKDYNQHRAFYSTMCLAIKALRTGGSLIFNATHVGLDGFFIGNMFLLSHLFEEVIMMKPVAGLDASAEVIIVGKGYIGQQKQFLADKILKGNGDNMEKDYWHRKCPLPRMRIPSDFVDRAVDAGVQRYNWMLRHNQRNLLLFRKREDIASMNTRKRYKIRTTYRWLQYVRVEDYVFGEVPLPRNTEEEEELEED